jgi:hypothetical protein
MENQNHHQHIGQSIRELYPTLTETELKEAEFNLRRYLEIADAIQQEKRVSSTDFDKVPNPTTIKERSNANLKS